MCYYYITSSLRVAKIMLSFAWKKQAHIWCSIVFCNLHFLFVLSKFHAININQLERMMLVYSVNTCQNKKSGVLELDSFQIASIVFYMNTLDKKSIKNEKQLRIAQGQRMRWISLSYCIPKWIQFMYVFGANKRVI